MRKWYWLAALTLVADQTVKAVSLQLAEPVGLIPGVLQFTHARNTGMAFSMFSGKAWLLGIVSAVCILAGWLILRRYRLGSLSRAAAMLMLGGAAGNMIDRFLRGYVVDMFEPLFIPFAVFNVADAALTIGTVLMGASLIFCAEDWREKDGRTKD